MILHELSSSTTPEVIHVDYHVIDGEINPIELFSTLHAKSPQAFLFESGVVKEGSSRFTFLGDASGPFDETITYNAKKKTVVITRSGIKESVEVTNVFDFLSSRLDQKKADLPSDLPFDFNLGYIGSLGYELKCESGGPEGHASLYHDLAMMFVSRMIAIDHRENKIYALHLVSARGKCATAEKWFESVTKEIVGLIGVVSSEYSPYMDLENSTRMSLSDVEDWVSKNANIRHSKRRYINKIREALSDISDGESYEVCLTNAIELEFPESPFELYRVMRQVAPAPYAAYLRIGGYYLVSASPERFVSVDRHRRVEAKPIKGTRPRGRTVIEDEQLINLLQNNEKDRAENLMIVDLLRNDLGRVCEISSISVPKLFSVESYSHVHQLVSTIHGKLKSNVSAVRMLRAVFPGGSMTGAPKKRTMEIIDRLEEGPRGAYSGALGWLGLCGACDFNILIRSVVIQDGVASFGVGGALTSLSNPEEEYQETIVKARGIVESIRHLRFAEQ